MRKAKEVLTEEVVLRVFFSSFSLKERRAALAALISFKIFSVTKRPIRMKRESLRLGLAHSNVGLRGAMAASIRLIQFQCILPQFYNRINEAKSHHTYHQFHSINTKTKKMKASERN